MADPKRGRLLIVDDEVELKDALCETLAEQGYETTGAASGAEGLQALGEQEFDLLLSDLMMSGMDGIQLLRRALEADPTLVGLIMTGQGTIPTAVEAIKAGAFDYVLKPFNLQVILPVLDRALEARRLRAENARLRQYVARLTYESPRYRLVGSGPAMQGVLRLIEKVAPTGATVLVRGESGTGKELVARALHHNGPRRDRPLVTVNCAALQPTLLESEFFGHERGAFTGAEKAKPGLVEAADGGTLFIDEVAEMAPALQAKLLRVLEDGSYRRVGGTRECRADVRVVAATNRPLEAERAAGRFREDLYHRLNVVAVELPPLRERREDIPELVEHLLATRPLGGTPYRVAADALEALAGYDWPGNVRELANVLERAQILAEGGLITPDDLPEAVQATSPPIEESGVGPLSMSAAERQAVRVALEHTHGNKRRAAQILGISSNTLYRLIAKFGLAGTRADAPALKG